MRYELRMTAYDMLDQVCVALVIWSQPDADVTGQVPVLKAATTVRGSGESDPSAWARDALVSALEIL